MARTFNPAAHPRDRFGRFTKSRTVKATPKDRKAAAAVAAGFSPKQVPAADREVYLKGVAGGKPADPAALAEASKALRAGKDVPDVDAQMVDLPDDVLLSRSVPLSAFGSTDPVALQGMKVRDAGFAPTQLGSVAAADGQVRMRIAAPAGTRAAVDPATGEVILDRDTEMVVARVVKTGTGHDMYLTVLPKAGPPKADGPAEDDAGRADLMKLRVPELRVRMRERGLKPGRMRKSQMVDALVADETGDTPAADSPGQSVAVSFQDRLAVAATGEEALASTPLSLPRQDTHGRAGGRTGLPVASREALLDYQGHTFSMVNGVLRGTPGAPTDHPFVRSWIADIDTAMDRSQLPRDITVHRGVRRARRMFGERLDSDMTGMVWREDAYLSTSAQASVTEAFARSSDGVRMRVLVPAGVGAVQVSVSTDADSHDGEAEILIARGQQLRVVADRGVDGDGVRTLDVEVVAA